MVLYIDDMVVSSTNEVGVGNLKARLAREFGINGERAAIGILEMKIFRDWNDRKFWMTRKSEQILLCFEQDADPVGTLFSIGWKLSLGERLSTEAKKTRVF